MSDRALILGGGGPVGIAWQCGLVVGLAQAVRLADADLVVGTSAGSVVGAHLMLGDDLTAGMSAVGDPLPVAAGADAGVGSADDALQSAIGRTRTEFASRESGLVALGVFAREAVTVDEAAFVGSHVFSGLAGRGWPAAFRCTAVDIATGGLQVWDATSGVGLDRAVASSCALPGFFPPVTIDGRRYIDGGMRTGLNAAVATGVAAAIAVSCTVVEPPDGTSDPAPDATTDRATAAQARAELTALRETGTTLELVVPGVEFHAISGGGRFLMDSGRARPAHEAGLRQAAQDAQRLSRIWTT